MPGRSTRPTLPCGRCVEGEGRPSQEGVTQTLPLPGSVQQVPALRMLLFQHCIEGLFLPTSLLLCVSQSTKAGEGVAWDSPWGMGRPGWHIECSAMSARYGELSSCLQNGSV